MRFLAISVGNWAYSNLIIWKHWNLNRKDKGYVKACNRTAEIKGVLQHNLPMKMKRFSPWRQSKARHAMRVSRQIWRTLLITGSRRHLSKGPAELTDLPGALWTFLSFLDISLPHLTEWQVVQDHLKWLSFLPGPCLGFAKYVPFLGISLLFKIFIDLPVALWNFLLRVVKKYYSFEIRLEATIFSWNFFTPLDNKLRKIWSTL